MMLGGFDGSTRFEHRKGSVPAVEATLTDIHPVPATGSYYINIVRVSAFTIAFADFIG
jgi:hypothetical protein